MVLNRDQAPTALMLDIGFPRLNVSISWGPLKGVRVPLNTPRVDMRQA